MEGIVNKHSGQPKIAGTRISVKKIVDMINNTDEQDRDRILHEYWELTDKQVELAVQFYQENSDLVEERHKNKTEK